MLQNKEKNKMSKILAKEGEIVVPGEDLANGMDYLPGRGTYREGENILSTIVGLFRVDGRLTKVIPLSGKYIPKRNDMIIGKVVDIMTGGWRIDFGYAFKGGISLKEGSRDFIPNDANLRDYYDVGDMIVGKIINMKGPKIIDISMTMPGCRKLLGGRIIKVESARVPRIIGKEGSMISNIKDATGCNITIGQNGLAWISGSSSEKEHKAVKAIIKVNDEAPSKGLTDTIKKFLEGKK
jgi:exosome complex component RRP4